jgi:hypothetical protein
LQELLVEMVVRVAPLRVLQTFLAEEAVALVEAVVFCL